MKFRHNCHKLMQAYFKIPIYRNVIIDKYYPTFQVIDNLMSDADML